MTSGLLGSTVMPMKYQARLVRRESLLANVQVLPPSSERYSPDFLPASIKAYTRWPSGATATPTRPHSPSGRPLPVTCVQVLPLSLERYSPPPGPCSGAYVLHGGRCVFHVPAKSMFGLAMAMARSETPMFGPLSRTRVQVAPPSVDLYTPRVSFGP